MLLLLVAMRRLALLVVLMVRSFLRPARIPGARVATRQSRAAVAMAGAAMLVARRQTGEAGPQLADIGSAVMVVLAAAIPVPPDAPQEAVGTGGGEPTGRATSPATPAPTPMRRTRRRPPAQRSTPAPIGSIACARQRPRSARRSRAQRPRLTATPSAAPAAWTSVRQRLTPTTRRPVTFLPTPVVS